MAWCSTRSIDLLRDDTKSRHLLSRWPAPRVEEQKVLRSAGMEGSVLSGTPRLGICACVQETQNYGGSWLNPCKNCA